MNGLWTDLMPLRSKYSDWNYSDLFTYNLFKKLLGIISIEEYLPYVETIPNFFATVYFQISILVQNPIFFIQFTIVLIIWNDWVVLEMYSFEWCDWFDFNEQ